MYNPWFGIGEILTIGFIVILTVFPLFRAFRVRRTGSLLLVAICNAVATILLLLLHPHWTSGYHLLWWFKLFVIGMSLGVLILSVLACVFFGARWLIVGIGLFFGVLSTLLILTSVHWTEPPQHFRHPTEQGPQGTRAQRCDSLDQKLEDRWQDRQRATGTTEIGDANTALDEARRDFLVSPDNCLDLQSLPVASFKWEQVSCDKAHRRIVKFDGSKSTGKHLVFDWQARDPNRADGLDSHTAKVSWAYSVKAKVRPRLFVTDVYSRQVYADSQHKIKLRACKGAEPQ